MLATISFCDIGWRALLDQPDENAARSVERFRGRMIKSTGDGFLATFDGPGRAGQLHRRRAAARR